MNDPMQALKTGPVPGGGQPLDPKTAIEKTAAMGNALWLMTQSAVHRNLLVSEVELLLLPPIAYGQFRLWRRPDNIPVGFMSWALVNDEVDARIKSGHANKLRHMEWKSGAHIWVMDAIFPFGGHELALKEVREVVFPGRDVSTVAQVQASTAAHPQ